MKKLVCFIISNLFLLTAYSQTDSINKSEKYSIINNVFKGQKGFFIYEKFENFKGMSFFLKNPNILKNMYGQPCNLEMISKCLKEVDILNEFNNITNESLIDSSLLNPNINLINSKNLQAKANVAYISEPVLINNLAFVYLKYNNEESIMILEKKKSHWKLLCNKYTFLIIED